MLSEREELFTVFTSSLLFESTTLLGRVARHLGVSTPGIAKAVGGAERPYVHSVNNVPQHTVYAGWKPLLASALDRLRWWSPCLL